MAFWKFIGKAAKAFLPFIVDTYNNITNRNAQRDANREQMEFAERMYARQREDALLDRDYANWYNSPRAEMQRLQEAGLNPNLVYGSGQAVNTSESVKGSSVPSYNPKAPHVNFGSPMAQYFDYAQRKAQVDLVQAQIDLVKAQTYGQEASTEKIMQDIRFMTDTHDQRVLAEILKASHLQTDVAIQGLELKWKELQDATGWPERTSIIANTLANAARTDEDRKRIQSAKKLLDQMLAHRGFENVFENLGIKPTDSKARQAIGIMQVLLMMSGTATQKMQQGMQMYNMLGGN